MGPSQTRGEEHSSFPGTTLICILKPSPPWMELGRGEGVNRPNWPPFPRGPPTSRWGCPDKRNELGGLHLVSSGPCLQDLE